MSFHSDLGHPVPANDNAYDIPIPLPFTWIISYMEYKLYSLSTITNHSRHYDIRRSVRTHADYSYGIGCS